MHPDNNNTVPNVYKPPPPMAVRRWQNRGGFASVLGRVRSPHISGGRVAKLQAASVPADGLRYSKVPSRVKVKVAHTRLPSVGFRS